jgi:hypothetical protein
MALKAKASMEVGTGMAVTPEDADIVVLDRYVLWDTCSLVSHMKTSSQIN